MTEDRFIEGEITTGRDEIVYYAKDMEEVGRLLTDDPTAKVILMKSGRMAEGEGMEYSEILVTYDPAKNHGAVTPLLAVTLYGEAHYNAYYAK